MLILLYRTKINIQKRWCLKIIFHCIDIAKTNGWILYRDNCDFQQISEKDIKAFQIFITGIAQALISKDKNITRPAGCPPKRSLSPTQSVGRNPISQHQSIMLGLMVMPTDQSGAKAEVDVNDAA